MLVKVRSLIHSARILARYASDEGGASALPHGVKAPFRLPGGGRRPSQVSPGGASRWAVMLAAVVLGWLLQLSSLQAGESVRALVYSCNPMYPPYHWSEDNQVFEGASVELMRLVLPAGVEAKPVVYPWKRSLMLAAEGKIDLLLSLRITPERSETLLFTRHRAFPNPIVVFVRKAAAFKFSSREDLKGLRGGISLGDTFGGGFDEYWRAELDVEQAPTMLENFRKLQAGRIDYFVSGYYLGLAHISRHHLEEEIVALEPPLSNHGIHFAFSKASPACRLMEGVDRRLEELDREGVPERLLQKHLQRFRTVPLRREPR